MKDNKKTKKRLNNKGFSFIEILVVFVILGILMVITIGAFSRYRTKTVQNDYDALAKSAYHAMEEYIMQYIDKDSVTLQELEEKDFLSTRIDPYNKEKLCTGVVEAEKTDGTEVISDSYKYKVHLCCSRYHKTYSYPEGTVTDLEANDFCDALPEDDIILDDNQYTVTYNGNGATGGSTSPTVCTEGSGCTLSANGFTKPDYIFTGWYNSKTGGQRLNSTILIHSNITVYAHWRPVETYTITYNGNGATGGSTASQSCREDVICTLRDNGFTRDGYDFDGWYDAGIGGSRFGATTQLGSNLTLFAHWKPKTYTVTFHGNGATGGSTPSPQSCAYNTACDLNANGFTKNGYLFAGWGTSAGSTSITYTNGQTVTNITTPGSNINLYAIWVINSQEFSYTGSIQTYTIPATGKYKLEAWGAQGENISHTGGYGGYAYGIAQLSAGTVVYIGVGGQGTEFNGGHATAGNYHYGSGGATHFATRNGQLSTLNSYRSDILLVAGGGGGASARANGGAGGGANQNGTAASTGGFGGPGGAGTTSAGGCATAGSTRGTCGSFGMGGTNTAGSNSGGSMGGGGFFGGGPGGSDYSNYNDNDDGAGGGGSGYANTSRLTGIGGTTGSRTGNGFAKLSWYSS